MRLSDNPITHDIIRDAELQLPQPAPPWAFFVKPTPKVVRTKQAVGKVTGIKYTIKATTNHDGEGRVTLYEDRYKVAEKDTHGQEDTDRVFNAAYESVLQNLGQRKPSAAPVRVTPLVSKLDTREDVQRRLEAMGILPQKPSLAQMMSDRMTQAEKRAREALELDMPEIHPKKEDE